MKERIKKFFDKASALLPGAASFIIAASWYWYHIPHSQKTKIITLTLITTLIIWVVFIIAEKTITKLLDKKKHNTFWSEVFPLYLKRLFCSFSILFLVFFSKHEIVSLIYFTFALGVFFFTLETILKKHPAAQNWLAINRLVFIWAIFLFIFNSIGQYTAFKYYILDQGAKYYNVSLFRAWAMTALWLSLFSFSYLIFLKVKNKARYLGIVFISTIFVLFIVIWMINIGVLYFSGLNITPAAVAHSTNFGNALYNRAYINLAVFGFISLLLFLIIKKRLIHQHKRLPEKYWKAYHYAIIFVSVFTIIGLSSFRTTPEFIIIKSFYQSITGTQKKVELKPIVKEKLKRFGINYNYDEFYLAHKETTFSTSSPTLLPPELQTTKPNIIIVFLESFSSRLTSVYNSPQVPSSTPGLEMMAQNPNTTIFKKYYNGSTPTVTGLIAQLCSILPPTGHNEIEKENRLRSHHLLCLPKILKQNGWEYSNYVTAVEKDFAHKDTIFISMGVDEVFGTEELRDVVNAKPLSWGYSDHQLFPAMEKILTDKKEPYLTILSTVDTHPPFTIAQDMVKYGDGKNNVLNSVHTTDDAFKIFWQQFVGSEAAKNTIVIAVADHAIFPTAITSDYFPDVAGKVNYYDELTYLMYVPNSILPKTVEKYSSSIDFTPTLLQVLGINTPNAFDGHSIFDDRSNYPNLLGMHEFGLYINEENKKERNVSYSIPSAINCTDSDYTTNPQSPLTLCEFLNFYQWKRQMFEEGRFWEQNN